MAQKAVIIGAGGMVGATVAHTLAVTETIRDIVLIDIAEDLVNGQAMDIRHATGFTHGVDVRAGSYQDIAEDDIVIITCGLAQKPGQTRLELTEANATIIRGVVRQVMTQGKPVYILMVTNPVDIMTRIALEASGLPKERVFGSGTTLDSARLRVHLAQDLHVAPSAIQAFVLGEHGDSSFAALSAASVDGIPLSRLHGYRPELVANVEQDVRDSAYRIIESKKATYYGIGHSVASIVNALQQQRGHVFPICSLAQGEYGLDDVVIGLPSLVSSYGVRILDGYPLSDEEQHKLKASALVVSDAWHSLAQPLL